MSRCRECDELIDKKKGDLKVPKQFRWEFCKRCIDKDWTYEPNDTKVEEFDKGMGDDIV